MEFVDTEVVDKGGGGDFDTGRKRPSDQLNGGIGEESKLRLSHAFLPA